MEHPDGADQWPDEASRREFLSLMAAGLALAGLGGCTRQPEEKIVPAAQPEEGIPGKPLFYATAMPSASGALGLLVESHQNRPTKVEGNPGHPSSLGSTDAVAQASVLSLYDPDRSQVVTRASRISTWPAFLAALNAALEGQTASRGAGLRLLTESVTSPTLARQIEELRKVHPAFRWHVHDAVGRRHARAGAIAAFGEDVACTWHIDRADVIVSLDADFLTSVRAQRHFADRRSKNRLYAIESAVTITGAAADHRKAMRAADVVLVARALSKAIDGEPTDPWTAAVAADLRTATGLVIAGETQPPEVHALAHRINERIGSAAIEYIDPIEMPGAATLAELVDDMRAGRVELLIVIGGNPAYTAPPDLDFTRHLERVPFRARLGLHEDETSRWCLWHVPEAHFLESWSDAKAADGTVSIVQPLIAPLYGGRSAHELLNALQKKPAATAHDIVRGTWRASDADWQTWLHDGLVPETASKRRRPTLRAFSFPARQSAGLEITFRPDPTVGDGAHANNAWLQELPKQITRLTWENAAILSEATAKALGVASEEMVELRFKGRTLLAPAWIVPGHPDDSVLVHLGYGRTHAGRVGNGAGFDAYALRTSDALAFGVGLELRPTGARHPLACTQGHHRMEGRDLVRTSVGAKHSGESLYPKQTADRPAWAMAIDLSRCIGCGACVVACQAENNIPTVGRAQVLNSREMHWLRVDRYFEGDTVHHQPVPCMHCESAPCEPVCPVAATTHSGDGLNEMVYNRCVGTRYCSNNCPYKVRRFNFLQYSDRRTPQMAMLMNPDVTVRDRGVMEKCTYCVQRISAARITAKKENRPIRDGEVQTACQAACPSRAIVFGDSADPASEVAAHRADPRNYGLLEELNTRPRTTYLARIRNPNPKMP